MESNNQIDRDAARRLLQALDTPDPLTCAQAELLLPALVSAEQSGVDVDQDPSFSSLLNHLDNCERCIALYAQMAEELNALAAFAEEQADQLTPPPPTFFAPVEQREGIALRIIRGLIRRFELTLPVPRLAPALATLSTGEQIGLFDDTLTQIEGSPRLSTVLTVQQSLATLSVTVRDTTRSAWQVQLTVGTVTRTGVTDDRGRAVFRELAIEQLHDVVLRCSELPAQHKDQ